jgi:DNA-binding SARP family transcriptional activator
MRLNQSSWNWIPVVAAAIVVIALTSAAPAADGTSGAKYKPAFVVKFPADSSPIVAAYLLAYRSSTSEVAIKRWEKLDEYANDGESIEDLTELILLRQAHYELMRLYYQNGRIKEGNRLLKKAENFTAYSVPEPSQAISWCKENKYCE